MAVSGFLYLCQRGERILHFFYAITSVALIQIALNFCIHAMVLCYAKACMGLTIDYTLLGRSCHWARDFSHTKIVTSISFGSTFATLASCSARLGPCVCEGIQMCCWGQFYRLSCEITCQCTVIAICSLFKSTCTTKVLPRGLPSPLSCMNPTHSIPPDFQALSLHLIMVFIPSQLRSVTTVNHPFLL